MHSVSHAPFFSSHLYSVMILFLFCKTSQLVFILIALHSSLYLSIKIQHIVNCTIVRCILRYDMILRENYLLFLSTSLKRHRDKNRKKYN